MAAKKKTAKKKTTTRKAAPKKKGARMSTASGGSISSYVSRYSQDVQRLLKQMRETIQNAAPAAKEKISYGIPTFFQKKNLVHFAAFKNRIGFYPGSSGIKAFKEELAKFKHAAGSVQFPFGEKLPLDLVKRITKFRVREDGEV